jgi:alpha-N-arabinofuranosidase
MRAADYAEKARIWAHGLRLVDPSIKLVSCGREVSTFRRDNLSEGETDMQGNDEWDEIVLKALLGSVDMHSIHFYTCLGHEKVRQAGAGLEYERNVFGPAVSSYQCFWLTTIGCRAIHHAVQEHD